MHPNCWTKNLTIGVFCMTKYDYGFKKQVVKAYLNGEGGYKFISKKYGIPDKSQVKKWVNAYKTLGDDGLKLKNKHTDYPIQFKLEVINYMTTTKSSLQETANHFGINNNSIIEAWKLKFLSGMEALQGKELTIYDISLQGNYTFEESNYYCSEEMLEKLFNDSDLLKLHSINLI